MQTSCLNISLLLEGGTLPEALPKALDRDPGALGFPSQLHLRLEISGLQCLADKLEPC